MNYAGFGLNPLGEAELFSRHSGSLSANGFYNISVPALVFYVFSNWTSHNQYKRLFFGTLNHLAPMDCISVPALVLYLP
jgi:hypothetical protein